MNNNTLGIIALSVVALGGIAAVTWGNKTHNSQSRFFISQAKGGEGDDETYGIIFQIPNTDPATANFADIEKVLNAEPAVYSAAKRKALYRYRRFDDGKPQLNSENKDVDTGDLPEADLVVSRELMVKYLPAHFTGYAFQIGIGGKSSFQKYPKAVPNMPQGRGKVNMRESKEMVEEINELLTPGQ